MPSTSVASSPRRTPRPQITSNLSMYTSDEPHLRSWFGHQAASKNRSAPAHAIGNATRAAYAMHGKGRASPGPIYMPRDTAIQRESAKVSFGTGPSVANETTRASTGPAPGAYDVVGSVGYQASSAARNAPSYRIGKMQRDTTGHDHGRPQGSDAFYNLRESVGEQVQSSKHTSARFVFGTSQRFGGGKTAARKAGSVPGPGSYRLPDAVGPQKVSDSRSTPAYGFGSSTRYHANRVYWKGKDTGGGGDAPGPIYSTGRAAVGGQVMSGRRSGAAYGFGTSSRFGPASSRYNDSGPGPGAYNA